MPWAPRVNSSVTTVSPEKKAFTAFTLIELVIVLTILAIIAAVAIPVFQNLQTQARNAATRGALAGMREAIQHYRMNEILSGRQPGTPGEFPDNGCPYKNLADYEQYPDTPKVMENGIVPDNPWARVASHVPATNENKISFTITTRGSVYFVSGGWIYDYDSCEIWANTAENDGTPSVNGENNCATDPTTENCF